MASRYQAPEEPQFETNGFCMDHGRDDCPLCGKADPKAKKAALVRAAALRAQQAIEAARVAAQEAQRLHDEAQAEMTAEVVAPAPTPAATAPAPFIDPEFQAWQAQRAADKAAADAKAQAMQDPEYAAFLAAKAQNKS